MMNAKGKEDKGYLTNPIRFDHFRSIYSFY